MFPWNIAKSAEAMFSRWAVKRVCKFFLKKKLGQFLLGEIDIDQLDVQLSEGTIQLNDLALNVDFLNNKFGAVTSILIKEGSIGSLLVKMPWKGRGCTVEVDELELVLVPSKENCSPSISQTHHSCQDQALPDDLGKLDYNMMDNAAKSTSGDIHEGVKTIAKMVKWFLTSFNVKIKKVIIAFDPCSEKDGNKPEFHRTLVLRISEIECGTCVSEDANPNLEAKGESFLGVSRLTNFVQFQGVVLELLHLDDGNNKTCSPCMSSSITTPIMTGKGGGFSGNLKLSIPWKNGSLDIRRVDSEVFIDPIEIQLQPSTIKWLLHSWEALKSFEKDGSDHMIHKEMDTSLLNPASHCLPSRPVSTANSTSNAVPISGVVLEKSSSIAVQDSCNETLLSGPHLISDWVPISTNKNKNVGVEEELDFGASVDQFFECFDGMRSSQSALGNSGMWNWTCSVFSAITAASSLASGSLYIPSEQQHVETNLKANFSGVSVFLSFQDEDQKFMFHADGDRTSAGLYVPYLGVECQDILLIVQVCPQEMRYEGTIKFIEIANYLSYKGDPIDLGHEEINSQNLYIRQLQADVQGVLPPLASLTEDSNGSTGFIAKDFPFGKKNNVVKVTLLKTSGVTHWQSSVKSSSSDGSLVRPVASFEVELSPFVFWVDFSLIRSLLELMKSVLKSVEKSHVFSLKVSDRKHGSSHGDAKRGSNSRIMTLSSTESLQGNILIMNARVILCFPFKSDNDVRSFASWNQFVALDFHLPLSGSGGIVREIGPASGATTPKRYSATATRSLHLKLSNIDVFLVCPASKDNSGINSGNICEQKFYAENILSVSNRTGCFSVISMLLQDGHVTGPWIAKKARFIATFEESKSIDNFVRKDYEFASVSTVNDMEDLISETRQEIMLSSTTFLHICLSATTIKLRSLQYKALYGLIDQIIYGLSSVGFDESIVKEASTISQTSFLVDCSALEIVISLDVKENVKGSTQTELPGSWHRLKLQLQKFTLMSVSNIGGIKGASFFWLAHAEGKLWGSITGVPDEEFVLISCNNSTLKRGDGGGSNALSSRLAGSDIVHLWDPESNHDFTSISLRCGTIVAVGGRLDWLDAIFSFFNMPSTETEKAANESMQKGDSDVSSGASFVLSFVDIGLSYEPYVNNLIVKPNVLDSESSLSLVNQGRGEENVACLLAASSLNLSNSTLANSTENEYKIRLQDLGLLICVVSESKNVGGTYNAECLHKSGYAKVAREALVEAILRTNCESGLLWEVECSKSHIYLETCHDTTSGLIRLGAQLQQLFAPDMEESVVHLQNRWDRVRREQEGEVLSEATRLCTSDSSPSTSEMYSSLAIQNEHGLVGLMDEIHEDAFQIDRNQIYQYDSSGTKVHFPVDENLLGELGTLSIATPEVLSHGLRIDGSVSPGLDSCQTSSSEQSTFPEFIERYCFPEFQPFTEVSVGRQSSYDILKDKYNDVSGGDFGRGNSGWDGDASLRIVEDHISDVRNGCSAEKFEETKLPHIESTEASNDRKATGRVLLRNIDVRWRMFAGFDWQDCKENVQQCTDNSGRDTTGCLELTLSQIKCQYEIFPIGGIHVSKLSLSVQDFHLYDMRRDAPWKLVLGYYDSKNHPRKSSSKAFKLDLEAVRPDPLIPLEEYRLQIAFLPMRLHLHQSQLDFLISFFGAKSSPVDQSSGCHQDSDISQSMPIKSNLVAGHNIVEEALLPYFQSFDMWPILVRVDYSPCRLDLAALRGGKYVELVNLVPWKGVELNLKHVHDVGIYGWDSVCETILGEWLEDISQNQVHKILRGLPPIRSVVALGAGAAKLVSLPFENYRKDKRVLKGMQRGISAFLRSISVEAVGLGVHLAAGAHDILLQAEYIFTNTAPTVPRPISSKIKPNVRSNQPKDAQQGIQQAYESLSNGLEKSASALVQTPLKKYQRGAGAGSALAAAVRAVPAAAIAPASACAGAVHYTLLGFRNSLDPERKKESMEKYLGPTQPWEQK
ncbi:autophagy-related protein 2 [Morus notabilis]|uniref:autophagy-related protein 2 n=1 Tax=Morus notabilis TaxID=981085 RepID=UPI000CED00F9|nr:autophagy-related protein 2 [Morus notabilis]XP_024029008.1 autophagy-related protein 2 [Morus notabilis]XP_024029009.1 autophagy-related protein 2 [Morus notabilis]XP_024029010.1 autophagy-related protein 2 [Morus notabilis]XP_024029012.1 autophagy-related protein 2 [Morus notabilis]